MPERVRVLFLGALHSTHAQNWIRLLDPWRDSFEVMGMQQGILPPPRGEFEVTTCHAPPGYLLRGYYARQGFRWNATQVERICEVHSRPPNVDEYWTLVRLLLRFRPQVIHTFGFTEAALLLSCIPAASRFASRWVLQTRGGSDVAFTHAQPAWRSLFREVLPQADAIICDNEMNFKIFRGLGIEIKRREEISIAPGSGGVDTERFDPLIPWRQRERLLLWNKAYESPWSKALPVLEGLRLAWARIQPVRCILTCADAELHDWLQLMPDDMRSAIELRERISQAEQFDIMKRAQVVLAPSLVDGLPNTLLEAMAAGAIPIVSPLSTLTPLFEHGRHVLFARNLYPNEIADALVCAFSGTTSEEMVDNNRERVKIVANRGQIAAQVALLYRNLSAQAGSPRGNT